jgi:hypothetical protein
VDPKEHHRFDRAPDVLSETTDDGDSKFWTAQRRLTLLHWICIGLILVALIAALIGHDRILIYVLGPLVVFAVMASLRARRKKHGLY